MLATLCSLQQTKSKYNLVSQSFTDLLQSSPKEIKFINFVNEKQPPQLPMNVATAFQSNVKSQDGNTLDVFDLQATDIDVTPKN